MRIDGTSGSDLYGLGGRNNVAGRKSSGAADPTGIETDVVASGPEKKYIARALAAADVDSAAVAEAKRLLASGQLDTPAAAQRAAEAILGS